MVYNPAWHDLVGGVGVALIIWAYASNLMGRMGPDDRRYPAMNATGAAFILFSLVFEFNLASAIVESFWLLISLAGLLRATRKKSTRVSNSAVEIP